MGQNTSNKLGTEKISRLLFQLALPAITAQIINMLYNIVDRIYIGHIAGIGTLALTGVGVCFPIITLITAFSSLIGMGGAPQASIRMGEKNMDEAERILGNCFAALLLLAVTLTAVFLIGGRTFLRLFGASSDTLPYAMEYLNIYVIGTLFVMISLGLNSFISAQGFAKISMFTVVIGAVINIILDPILIFGLHMGVQGAALATIISQCVSAVWVLKFLTGPKTTLRIKFANMKISKRILFPGSRPRSRAFYHAEYRKSAEHLFQHFSAEIRRRSCCRLHDYSDKHYAGFITAAVRADPRRTADRQLQLRGWE